MEIYAKSLWSHNPIPGGCQMYLPLWALALTAFKSIDPYGRTCTVVEALRTNEGYDFDGIDDVIQAGAWGFSGNKGSFGAWIKGHDTPPSTTQNIIDFRGDGILAMQWSTAGGGLMGLFSVGVSVDWNTVAPSDVAYHHIFFVLNGTSAILYLDNVVQDSTQTITAFSIASSTALGIGNLSAGGAAFDGEIGEVWIYNRALSAGEIAHIYNVSKGRYL